VPPAPPTQRRGGVVGPAAVTLRPPVYERVTRRAGEDPGIAPSVADGGFRVLARQRSAPVAAFGTSPHLPASLRIL
jgi:hypothetical protein